MNEKGIEGGAGYGRYDECRTSLFEEFLTGIYCPSPGV